MRDRETEAAVNELTQSLRERLGSGMFLAFLVWVSDGIIDYIIHRDGSTEKGVGIGGEEAGFGTC